MPAKQDTIPENTDGLVEKKKSTSRCGSGSCGRFFTPVVSLTAGGFVGLGIENAMGDLGINFFTFNGALPAIALLFPTLFCAYRLFETFKDNTAALIGTQILLGGSAVVLSKCISACMLALVAGTTLNPIVLPFMISAGLTMIGLFLLTCCLNSKKPGILNRFNRSTKDEVYQDINNSEEDGEETTVKKPDVVVHTGAGSNPHSNFTKTTSTTDRIAEPVKSGPTPNPFNPFNTD